MTLQPRVVQVYRRSEYDELLVRHSTRQQAEFFLQSRGRTIEELADPHARIGRARELAGAAIPPRWRRAEVERGDLYHFRFAPDDLVLVVGQDGVVANTAKYLDGQPVIGINPEPAHNPGVLVPHAPEAAADLLRAAAAGRASIEHRTMVGATTDDGQRLRALNEIYLGHRSHQSARYRLESPDGGQEHHSSSGLLAGTGTGATGWLRSAWQERASRLALPAPDSPELCWFAREAWPSLTTGTELTEGLIVAGATLRVQAESDELVCFGDGIESDALRIGWGQTVTIAAARQALNLVVGR
ncbi:MAG: hypothetical protein ACK5PP_04255 [Acidimicrobiales bacterium]